MKCKLFILAAVSTMLFLSGFSQSCEYFGTINTDPRAPINDHSPLKKNYFFWFNPVYPLNWINNNLTTQVDGPYFQINNPITNNLLDSKDMMPEDGWEMVTKGNGYNDNSTTTTTPATNPYVVLYNKYTGVLRVFFIIGDRLQNYNSMRVEVSFFGPNQTSLLDLGEGEVKALDQTFVRDIKINGVHEYINDKFNWFYADYPMNYDPCTCMYESKIQIIPYLNETYKLEMEGQTTGTIVDLNSSQKKVDKDLSFSDKINFLVDGQKKAVEFFKTTGKVVATVTETINSDNDIPSTRKTEILNGITNFVDATKAPDFLRAGLDVLPWAKEAVSLFNFFVGGGKSGTSAQQVRIQPMAINMSSKFKGTLTNTHPFLPIIIKTPGSKIPANTTIEYPHYNKRLGVFNLLRQPNFALFNSYLDATGENYWSMVKLNQQLTMVLNFDASADIVEVLAALSYERAKRINPASYPTSAVITNSNLGYFNQSVYDNFQILDGKTSEGREVWRTDYFKWCDIMNKHWWYFDGWRIGGGIDYHISGNFSIKFLIRLRRRTCPPGVDCQDILLVKKYKLKLVGGSITVSFDPNDHCNDGVPYLADYSDEESFCRSADYKNGRILQSRITVTTENDETLSDAAEPDKSIFREGIYPNPAPNNYINMKIGGTTGKDYNCIITDVIGRRHSTFRYNTSQGIQRIDIGKLPEGVYIIKAYVVSKPTEYKIFKFVKSRL